MAASELSRKSKHDRMLLVWLGGWYTTDVYAEICVYNVYSAEDFLKAGILVAWCFRCVLCLFAVRLEMISLHI